MTAASQREGREVAEALYGAFSKRDGAAMTALYAPDARFTDPVFPRLEGAEIGAMWRMLCWRGKDLELEWEVRSDRPDGAQVRWEARYTFSATGRKVHNIIDATLVVRDGLIVEHTDRFNLWRWTRQALGPVGVVLGWSPLVQGQVRRQAAAGLAAFRRRES